jgi:hypothetical protein
LPGISEIFLEYQEFLRIFRFFMKFSVLKILKKYEGILQKISIVIGISQDRSIRLKDVANRSAAK